jgi:exodeoxyribonuclease VII large subunit
MATALRNGVARGGRKVERLEERLLDAMRTKLQRRRLAVDGLRDRLMALGPMEVLRRGYALALDSDGVILRGVKDFEAGRRFVLRLRDGRVRATVEEVSDEV